MDLLDVGAGDGSDSLILADTYSLNVTSLDIELPASGLLKVERFLVGSIFDLPFSDEVFDYVYVHDVLHHIDQVEQSSTKHRLGLSELARVVKPEGYIIIVEGNRYNPLFYPHMVRLLGHNHWKQRYFRKTVSDIFPKVKFSYFEAHVYPRPYWVWNLYERFMEKFSPCAFLAYNVAIAERGNSETS